MYHNSLNLQILHRDIVQNYGEVVTTQYRVTIGNLGL